MNTPDCPVEKERIRPLNRQPVCGGRYVLYWMQQSQRVEFNPALEYALWRANQLKLPLVVGFGLTAGYPEANLRHYQFMLEGLRDVQSTLAARGVLMAARVGDPPMVAAELAKDAAVAVCDRGYLRHQRRWRAQFARAVGCEVIEVDGDVVVPGDCVSDKAEYAARTIRPRILRRLDDFLHPLEPQHVDRPSIGARIESLDLSAPERILACLDIDRSVPPVGTFYQGGHAAAVVQLRRFLRSVLRHYDEYRNRPEVGCVSHLGMYLHFGHISPVHVALAARNWRHAAGCHVESFLEELIVRRELAHNFVWHNPHYDSFNAAPAWAWATLEKHRKDPRPYRYSAQQLDRAETHDPYWNAAMREMKYTGYMHNYMRMYWGKKIIEWTASPKTAYRIALQLNNRYFLDGRDPNSYAGVAWLFGVHDRPWQERRVFGTIRYMNAAGLERKSDIELYVARVNLLVLKAWTAGIVFPGD